MHSNASKQMRGNTNMPDYAQHLLTDNIIVQGQPAQFMRPDEPFRYLGILVQPQGGPLGWAQRTQGRRFAVSPPACSSLERPSDVQSCVLLVSCFP